MRIKLKNVRLSFPQLFHAKAQNEADKPVFSAAFIFPKNHPCVADINAAIEQVAKERWGDKAEVNLKAIRAAGNTFLYDGAIKADKDGYEGNLFINTRSPTRPNVFGRDGTPLVEQDGKPYGGCYVHAVVDVWAQDSKFGKRINASLKGVMFYEDGEAFAGGGGSVTIEDFADLMVAEDVADIV